MKACVIRTFASLALALMAAVAAGEPLGWVTNESSDNVTVFGTSTGSVVATIPVGDVPAGIALNPCGTRAYVTNWYSRNLLVLDTATRGVVADIYIPGSPNGVAVHPDGSRVYVARLTGPDLVVVDAATNTAVKVIPLSVGVAPDYAMYVALNPSGSRAYVTQLFSNTVAVVDTLTEAVLAHIPVAKAPTGIAVNPAGTKAFVASQSDVISVIDLATNTVTAAIPVQPVGIMEKRALMVAVNPTGTRAYVTNGVASSVSVVDTASNTIVATIPVNKGFLRGVALTPSGSRMYVASSDGSIVAIDPASNVVTGSIPAGSGPGSIAIGPDAAVPSAACVGGLVRHYYESALRRESDPGGQSFWESEAVRVAALGADVNEAFYAMAMAFFASSEYAAFNRDNTGFATDLYTTFFDRAPDAGGLAFWKGLLDQGMPREVALASFIFSTEFADFTRVMFGSATVRAEVDTVLDFYRGLLARLPDDGGFAFWLGKFRAAQCAGAAAVTAEVEAISSAYALSPEYAARARSDSQYIGDLYNAFLRRGGDLAGVQFWIGQLATRTREAVRVEFRNSPEFQARVNAIVALGCMP